MRWGDKFSEGMGEECFRWVVVVVEGMAEEDLREGVDGVGLEVVAYPF